MEHIISSVAPGSIAQEMGIEPGDRLLEVNGKSPEDVFDYRYLMNEEEILVLIRKANGEEWELEIEKEYEEDLGMESEYAQIVGGSEVMQTMVETNPLEQMIKQQIQIETQKLLQQ